jgi:flagellar biosynthesis/type III secretory pathway protein FliH
MAKEAYAKGYELGFKDGYDRLEPPDLAELFVRHLERPADPEAFAAFKKGYEEGRAMGERARARHREP